jgi:hypothetical protein
MKDFSMGSAWSFGFRFVAERGWGHASILIGIGILAPVALQYALIGEGVETANPAMLGRLATGPGLAAGTLMAAVLAASYVLQTGSYFGSWRLGLSGPGQSLGGAAGYGLLAGLLSIAVLVAIAIVAVLAVGVFGSSGLAFLVVLIFFLPLLAAWTMFYTLGAVVVAAALALLLSLAMLFGSAIGQVGLAATLVGGSGGIAVLLLVLSVVTIWLAARFSCTTALMAERRSLNLIAAMRDSWRLTWDEQWAITRYLALIGFGLALLVGAVLVAIGAGAGLMQGQAMPELGVGAILLQVALAIPFAFLSVMVPAGIYKEVGESDIPVDVFA